MIIGFTGYKQSGKSTAAKYLEEKYNFTRINFKDALVQEIKDNFPDLLEEICLIYEEFSFPKEGDGVDFGIENMFQTKPPLMRALLQNYGTEVRRKDDQHYWV